MIIYPAIDIQNGKCVMLRQGVKGDSTTYGHNPVDIALKWQQLGAQFLHLIDLDGAILDNASLNLKIIEDVKDAVNIPIQVGGGIRDIERASYLLDEVGIDRIILGTAAIQDIDLLKELSDKYPGRVAVAVDAQDGVVAIEGWTKKSNTMAIDLCKHIEEIGIDTVIYTDILKDGMLSGPNLDFSKILIEKTKLKIIVSGGVTSLSDIKNIKALGAYGAIIGKGLYEELITLPEAIKIAKEEL